MPPEGIQTLARCNWCEGCTCYKNAIDGLGYFCSMTFDLFLEGCVDSGLGGEASEMERNGTGNLVIMNREMMQ
jgi:hypothetical protein